MQELIYQYNDFRKNFPFKNEFYHLISVRNFINNFNKIVDIKDKKSAEILIENYFVYAEENEIENNNDCKKIYYLFIAPLGMIYKRNMKYILLIKRSTIIFSFVLTNVFLYIFKTKFLFLALIDIAFVLIYIKNWIDLKKDNVYGFNL